MKRLFAIAGTIGAILSTSLASAKSKTDIVIEPGPATISAEERALEADPAAGTEHAVVLVYDVERDDRRGTGFEKGVHVRAKILSNEGRSLGDVEIPVGDGGKLKRWWGKTLLPDGTVLELAEGDLKRQSVARGEGFEVSALKGALPGIVPGAVIDYGYVLLDDGMPWLERVEVQRPWFVRQMRYRWRASDWLQAAWSTKRLEGIEIDIQKDRESILVLASNVPPLREELHMPPDGEVRASVTLYYISRDTNFDKFWEDAGRRMNAALEMFLRGKGVKEVVEGLPAGSTDERLRAAYDWVEKSIRRTGYLSAEEVEAGSRGTEGDESAFSAKRVLERKEGTAFEIAALYAGMAREIGAQAWLVFAPDRTERYWDQNLRSLWSFDYVLVAVEPPAEGGGKTFLVDPGSGLPYGDVPWWIASVQGMLCTPKGAKAIPIPLGDGRKNTLQTKVAVSFSDDLDAETANWTRSSQGQEAFGVRHRLRRMDPDARQEELEIACGGGGESEVLEAVVDGLDQLGGDLRLRCKRERSGLGIDPEVSRARIEFGGPWLSLAPDLGATAERRHPAIFDYQWIGTEEIVVSAPPGFEPEGKPFQPVQVDSPYGRYTLRIDVAPTAYRVQRMLAFGAVHVPAADVAKLRSFVDEIRRHDRTPLEFVRKSEP